MVITPSQLRADVYRILDQALATGRALQIKRRGKLLKIVPLRSGGKMDRLIRRQTMKTAPDRLVHSGWTRSWKPLLK
ncbi:MAG: type II toxin-antitoxin system Phd/YefM family antitoxin [Deltaproteobacteria bacterium]|nr:type II toxin-antitoxin system Phd/YefM family antitoxin [Deltaproteobacteria bacterium]